MKKLATILLSIIFFNCTLSSDEQSSVSAEKSAQSGIKGIYITDCRTSSSSGSFKILAVDENTLTFSMYAQNYDNRDSLKILERPEHGYYPGEYRFISENLIEFDMPDKFDNLLMDTADVFFSGDSLYIEPKKPSGMDYDWKMIDMTWPFNPYDHPEFCELWYPE